MSNDASDNKMRIFITTCRPMWRVEKALEYSIMKYCTEPFEVTFLRSGDPGWETNVDLGISHTDIEGIKKAKCWNIGRSHPRPYSGEGWQTPFTCFRFAIPELCGFQGRAIHMDADFLVQRDLRPIFEMDMSAPVMSPHKRTDFMIIDCSRFQELELMDLWPSIENMRFSGDLIADYMKMLNENMFISEADHCWESWDGKNFNDESYTIHYTDMNTQPWKPYPEYFTYPQHPSQEVTSIFWEHYAEALEAEARGEITLLAKDITPADKTPLSLKHQ